MQIRFNRANGIWKIRREMKGPSIIFACLISRGRISSRCRRRRSQSQSQLRVALLPSHANMSGHGDVTSGVSFFAACTYHWRARGERQRKERKKERERERKRSSSTPTLQSPLQCMYACTFTLRGPIHMTDAITEDIRGVGRCEVRFGECRRR